MRLRTITALIVVLTMAGGCAGLAQGLREPRLTTLAETDAAHPGSTIRLALRVSFDEGLHVQSNQPRDESLIPTRLWVLAPEGVTDRERVFPSVIDLPLPGFTEPVAVYPHAFVIGVALELDERLPPGPLVIPARLQYQACDDRQCFPPRTIDTRWTIQIVPATRPLTRLHADVFGPIAFGRGVPPPSDAAPASRPVAGTRDAASADVLAHFDQFTVAGRGEYMNEEEFLTFIRNAEAGIRPRGLFEGRGPIAILAIVFVGGLALNLTPCVLPMIPINLMIIGAGAQGGRRGRGFLLGAAYGAAMALVYGLLGLLVVLTAGTFGTINASPWFNLGIAALFVVLALAMFDVINIDFSRLSSRIRFSQHNRGTFMLAFAMGAVAALLAGACVAPVVIQVVVFSSNLYAAGTTAALALPFVLGLGMALPWPIAGAGFSALPKPGAWMVRVKQAMGVFILGTAMYYGYVGYGILASRWVDPATVSASAKEKIAAGWHSSIVEGLVQARLENKPVLVDFWATWCKNCLVMDRTTLASPAVDAALDGYVKIKFQAEDPSASPARELMQRVGGRGLPTYVILQPK
jgi:cytochrome c biogenesis protein CcdA